MNDQPELGEIIDHLEGRLDPGRAREVAGHLARADQATLDTVAWLQRFHQAAAGISFSPPPPALLRQLHELMPARPSLAERLAGAVGEVRELVARLVQDLAAGPMVAGARGASEARQLLFEADDGTEIAIRILADPNRPIALDGQIFGDAPARPLVLTDATGQHTGVADEAGEFSFPEVAIAPGATLGLVVQPGTAAIRIDLTPYLPHATQEQP